MLVATVAMMPADAHADLNWHFGGVPLDAGQSRNITLIPRANIIISFTFMTVAYEVRCTFPDTPNATGTIVGAVAPAPGTDTVLTMPFQNNCAVRENSNPNANCLATVAPYEVDMWKSRLALNNARQKTDIFENFKIKVVFRGPGCPALLGGYRYLSGNIRGTFPSSNFSSIRFLGTTENNLTGEEITTGSFLAEYVFDAMAPRFSIALNGGSPDWDINGTLLTSAQTRNYVVGGESVKLSSTGRAVKAL